MAIPHQERNLVVGILALRMDFITREQLMDAMRAWQTNKQTPLEDVLVARQALRPEAQEFLWAMATSYIEGHGGDLEKCLAGISSHSSLYNELRDLADEELSTTIDRLPQTPSDAPAETISFRPAAPNFHSRFRVIRPYAHGGLGHVSVAHDNELNRDVALKEIREKFAADPDSRQRFLQEAEITGRLEHPSIVPVYSLGKFGDGRPFYVMRFIRGDSLKEAIAALADPAKGGESLRQWQRNLRKLIGRLIDVCNAIEYAHSRGILHRDIKPRNIMLGKYGETLVVDWGLAKAMATPEVGQNVSEGPLRPSSGESSSETEMGTAIGTPAFMSPEQAEGQLDQLGPATDVYSLGATLYCVLTKQPPFTGESHENTLTLVRRGEFRPPRAINPKVPRPLEAICLKAMARDRHARYASPHELAEDLERWLADEPVSVYRDPWIDRGLRAIRRHKGAFVCLTLLLVTVLSGLAVYSRVITRKNADLQAARQRADANRELAEKAQVWAEENLLTSRTLAVDLLELAENDLSKIKGKEALRKDMTARTVKLYRDFHQQKPADPSIRFVLAHVIRIEANVSRSMGNTAAALQSYDEAVSLLEGVLAEKWAVAKVRDRLSETLRDQANALKLQGQIDKAARAFARAQQLAAELIKEFPRDQNYRRTLAMVDLDQSDLLGILGKPDEALQTAQRAVTTFRELIASGSKYPLETTLLLLAQAQAGELLLEHRQQDAAQIVLGDAIARARQRLEAGTDRSTQYLLGRLLTAQGRLRAQQAEPASAPDVLFEEAIVGLQKLTIDFPAMTAYPRYLAAALNARGDWLLEKKADATSAAADFERAHKAVVTQVHKTDTDIADLGALAESTGNLGRAAAKAENNADAAAKFQEAIRLYDQILERAPVHTIVQRRREKLAEQLRDVTSN